ncbi:tRNA delta(2)-isopentenylpyrophosphate transferase [gamma proteobacterium HdN1]|nr:tRNA delta(2)-isopentenylpyrophosphate transferase [gamma proteobacterium HdN1]
MSYIGSVIIAIFAERRSSRICRTPHLTYNGRAPVRRYQISTKSSLPKNTYNHRENCEMSEKHARALFLMGPTAAGKTAAALTLAAHGNCQLISVDSALIYRGMDIGTAKPDAATLARFPHRLVDIRDPAEAYSAAEFREDALREMAEIHAFGATPVLVGGTMLYYRALQQGMADLPPANPEVRAEIEAIAQTAGWPQVHALLAAVDPIAANRIHPTDPQRLQRALEVYKITGVPLSEWHQRQKDAEIQSGAIPWNITAVALCPPQRSSLHEAIARRFRQMLEDGFEEEVLGLRARGDLTLKHPSMRAVGYRQMWEYLDGTTTRDQMIEQGIVATRQLAKRQITWLRSWPSLQWLDPMQKDLSVELLKIIS